MEIGIRTTGSWDKTQNWLDRLLRGEVYAALDRYGQEGADALARATPQDSGKTAASWGYRVTRDKGGARIEWFNDNVNDGVNIAVIIQYGHGTGTGGYVVGRDYINPTMRPIFDKIAENVWKEVTK